MASTTWSNFVKASKIGTLRPIFDRKLQIFGLNTAKCVSKRNAGELPQPFWLGAACGGSHSLSASVARA